MDVTITKTPKLNHFDHACQLEIGDLAIIDEGYYKGDTHVMRIAEGLIFLPTLHFANRSNFYGSDTVSKPYGPPCTKCLPGTTVTLTVDR